MPQPTEILHILLCAEQGGCERNCQCLCASWPKARHTVLVLGPEGPISPALAAAGAAVVHLDVMCQPRRVRLEALRRFAATTSAKSLIAWHGMPELPLIAHAFAGWGGSLYAHGGNPARRNLPLDLRYLLAERLWPNPHRPIYVCCSQYVADSFERSFYLRRFRRAVALNGVVAPDPERMHRPRALSGQEEIVVGMTARLDIIKDHATVLRALALARRKSLPNLRLELLGDGPHRAALAALAAELGVSDAVRFLGNRRDVYETMATWDGFLYATTRQEGFGNALAEAMMLGLPAVVTDIGPMREVGGAGGEVAYVPAADAPAMADAWTRLVFDEERRQEMSQAARRRAQQEFSSERFARRYQEILLPETLPQATPSENR